MHHRLVPVEAAPVQSSPPGQRSGSRQHPPSTRPSEIHAAIDRVPGPSGPRRGGKQERRRRSGGRRAKQQRGEARTNVEEPLVSALGKKKNTQPPPGDVTLIAVLTLITLRRTARRPLLRAICRLGHCEFLMSEAFFSCFGPDSCGRPSAGPHTEK